MMEEYFRCILLYAALRQSMQGALCITYDDSKNMDGNGLHNKVRACYLE